MKRSWFVTAAGVLGLAAIGAGCVGPGREDVAVPVIGVILPLTGDESAWAAEVLSGMRLRAAGSLEAPVELVSLDGAGQAVASARRLTELARSEHTIAVIGGAYAAVARPLASLAEAQGMPFLALSPLSAPAGGASPVRVLHHLEATGRAAAIWARADRQWSAAGLVRDPESEASWRVADAFSHEFTQRGGRLAWTVAPDETGRLDRPEGPETAVDVVYVAGPTRLVEVVAGFGPGTADAAFLTAAGWESSSAETAERRRFHVTGFVPGEDRPPAIEFRDACEAAGVDPTPARALGWDAVGAVLRLATEGSFSRAGVEQALRAGGRMPGVTGPLAIRGGVGSPAIIRLDPAGDELMGRVPAEAVAVP